MKVAQQPQKTPKPQNPKTPKPLGTFEYSKLFLIKVVSKIPPKIHLLMRCVETATRAFFSLPKTLAFVISWLVPLAEFFFMAFDLSLTLSCACKRLSSAWSATVCPPVSTLASLVEILSLPRPSLRLCYFRSCLVSRDMYASSSASASPSPSCGPPSSSCYFPLKRLFKLLFLAAI